MAEEGEDRWAELHRAILVLDMRLTRLEREFGYASAPPAVEADDARDNAGRSPAADTGRAAAVAGRSLVGLAGAYLLRALTEFGFLPSAVGVAAGIGYALLWLVRAARTPPEKRLETGFDTLTSVLILAPLLWEATLRFRVIMPWTAAGVLVFFTVFGLAISWRRNHLMIATMAILAGLGTAGALFLGTRDLLPFTFAFLAIAAAVECSACLDHWLDERWLAAASADLFVLLATYLVTNARGLPQSYVPTPAYALLAAQAALLFIYLSSAIVRTLLRGFTFTGFETVQCAAAFLIGIGGGLRLARGDAALAAMLGGFTLLCAAACYFVSFSLLDHRGKRNANFYTYATFGMLLAVTGSAILLSGTWLVAAWSACALACAWAGARWNRLTLTWHAGIYVVLTGLTSGGLGASAALLLGAGSGASAPGGVVWVGLGPALLTYAVIARRSQRSQLTAAHNWLLLMAAGTAVWQAAGASAAALMHAFQGAGGNVAYDCTLRTFVIATGAVSVALAGRRWQRRELSMLTYPLMGLGAYRLVAQDLRQGHTMALFLSLLVYGATLSILPRLFYSPKRASEGGSNGEGQCETKRGRPAVAG